MFTKLSAITSVDRFIALSLFVNDSLKAVLKRQNRQYSGNLKKNVLTNSELSLNNYFVKLKRVVATGFCGFV